MRPSIRRWLDWAANDVLPLNRNRPRGAAIRVRREKAGQIFDGQPIPWNADAAILEVGLRIPVASRLRSQFTLRVPGCEPVFPHSLLRESGDRHRISFRIPVPQSTAIAELHWKQRPLARVEIPVLSESEFLGGLSVSLPMVFASLGSQAVSARSFIGSQCRGLAAMVVVRSPTPLAPLADLGVAVTFRNEQTGRERLAPVAFTNAQLGSNEAVLSATLPRVNRCSGTWSVSWHAGDRELARQIVQGIPANDYERSVYVVETCFLHEDKSGRVRLVKELPLASRGPSRPCFLVASAEPGTAGLVRFRIHATGSGSDRVPDRFCRVLVTDIPTAVVPEFDAGTEGITGFELRLKGRTIGFAPTSAVPGATLTAEGGFKPPPDFTWSQSAEEELQSRLNRLMNGEDGGSTVTFVNRRDQYMSS